ncbi:MAG TPA: PocR ligand-binding domain-containing protein [Terriglobales bacterium]|nr:PocR ligand-binding domain-containing protein [Terriglobales bacterium]
MTLPSTSQNPPGAPRFVVFCSGLPVFVGLTGIAGLAFHNLVLRTVLPGMVAIAGNTSICFILLGLSLWWVRERDGHPIPAATRWLAKTVAGIAALAGLLSLIEFLWAVNLGIDQLLFTETAAGGAGHVRAGLMSPFAALSLVLLGLALLLLDWTPRRMWPSQLLSFMVGVLGVFTLLEVILSPARSRVHIALPTVIVLSVFPFGVICSRPRWALGGLLLAPRPMKAILRVLTSRSASSANGSWIVGCELGVLLAVGATLIREMLPGLPPYITYYPAVMIAALIGGFGPGILTSVFSTLLADYFFLEPVGDFWVKNRADAMGMLLFLANCVATSWLASALDRARAEVAAEPHGGGNGTAHFVSEEDGDQGNGVPVESGLRAWSVGGILLGMALTALGGFLTWNSIQRASDDSDLVSHTHAVEAALESILADAVEIESGARGFAATGDEALLGNLLDAEHSLPSDMDRLGYLTSDNLYQQNLLRDLRSQMAARIAVADRIIAERQSTGKAAPVAMFREGKQKMDAVRETLKQMRAEESHLLEERTRRSEEARHRTTFITFGSTVGGVLLLLVAGIVTSREIGEGARLRRQIQLVNSDLERRVQNRTAALRESEQRLALFIDHAPVALAMFDREMRYLRASRRWMMDFGLGDRDLRGLSHYEIFPDVSEPWKEVHRQALAGKVLKEERDPFHRQDGTVQWLRWEIRPWYEIGGEIGGILIFSEDITERVEAEESLRLSDERFQAMINGIPQLAWMAEPDGHIFWYNQRWYDYTGTTLEEMVGWGWQRVHDPEKLPSVLRRWRASIANTEPFEMEFPLRGADGRFRMFLTRILPLKDADGRVIRWLGTNTDISELKQAEETIREREERIRALLDSTEEAILGEGLDGQCIFCNAAAVRLLGYEDSAELVGKNLHATMHHTSPEGFAVPLEECELLRAIRAGERYHSDKELLWRSDGSSFSVECWSHPLLDGGKVVGSVLTFIDVTERRRVERALRTLSACNDSLVRATDEPTLLTRICDLVVNVGGYRLAWVGFADHDEKKSVRVAADSGVNGSYVQTANITWADEERGRGPAGTAIRTGKLTICSNVLNDPSFAPWRESALQHGYHSVLASPLKMGGEVFGVLSIYAGESPAFDADEQNLLEELAANLSYGIMALRAGTERREAEEEVRKLNHDLENRVEQRTAELRASEERVRRKLDSILLPEGDFGNLELADILDVPSIKLLLDDFYAVVRVTTALLDLHGNVLTGAGWQNVCLNFHRVNSETCKNCHESDLELSAGIQAGEFKIYKCKNNLWDVATPIVVGGKHIGNLFCGQFFFVDEPVDYELYRAQARKYGFDEEQYMAALKTVPCLTREQVNASMTFLAKLAKMISQLSYSSVKLARSTEQLNRANVDLQNSVKEMEAFSYSVSHDLRAPLRHVSGFSKILVEEFGPTLPAEARRYLDRIQESNRRMGQLIDDLLDLGRVGRREVNLQVVGLKSVVDEVIAGLKPEVGDRDLEWKIGTLPFADCDAGLMKQVFQNLLTNAVKFTRPRGHAVIEIGQTEDGVIFVRDNGVGFSMKYSDKLFGVFQRLHRQEDFEGTGVGLATVQRIVQKHGGRIWAEAELDKGATFFFTLDSRETNGNKSQAAVAGEKT